MTTLKETWDELPLWVSATQAREFLNISRQTLAQYLLDGKLVHWRGETVSGNKGPYRISKDSLGEFCGLANDVPRETEDESL